MNYRLALLLSLFLVYTSIHAATVTWTNGNGTSIWHDPLNWDTGNIPGVNDVAVFDATNTSDCEIKLDASVKGLTISAGYTGTVSYAEEFTVGSDGISIADGFFVSGSEVLDVTGNLTISNGSFTAPISELTLDGNLTVGVTGILVHSNGTISFQGGGNRVINTSSNAEFYNLTVSKGNNVSLNLNTGDTVTVLNKLVLENGRFGSGGTVLIDDTCHILSGFDKVKADIRFSGPGNGHYIVDRDNLDFDAGTYVDKDNTTDTVFFSTSSGTMYVGDAAYDLSIQGGTVAHEDNASIDMNYRSITIGGNGLWVGSSGQINISSNYTSTGNGSFVHNQGTVVFDGGSDRTYTVNNTNEFFNVSINKSNSKNLNITAGDSMRVINKLLLADGKLNAQGVALVNDTCHILSGFDKVKADIRFSGPGNGHYIVDRDNLDFDGGTYVDKENTTDTVFFSTSSGTMYVGDAAYDLSIQGGTIAHEDNASIDMNYRSITIGGNGLWVGSSGQINISSNYTSTGNGSFVHNQGTVVFDGGSDRTYTVNNTNEFFNVSINKSNSKNLNITAGDSMRVINKLLLADGKLNAQGVALVNDTCHILSGFDKVKADIRFSGSGNGHYIVDRDNLDFDGGTYVDKDNTTDTVFFSTSSGTMYVGDAAYDLSIQGGTIAHEDNASIDMNYRSITIGGNGLWVGSSGQINISSNYTSTGNGSFVHNQGTVVFDGGSDRTYTVNNTNEFFNVSINKSNSKNLNITAGDSMRVINKLLLADGKLNAQGVALVNDTCHILSGFDKVKADIRFSGSGNGHYIVDRDNLDFDGGTYVDKDNTTDTVFFSTSTDTMYVGDAGFDLIITNGILAHPAGAVVEMRYGTISILSNGSWMGSDAEIRLAADLTRTGSGSFIPNSGAFRFVGGRNQSIDLNNGKLLFNDLILDKSPGSRITLNTNDTIHAGNNLILVDGRSNGGYLGVSADVDVRSGFDQGTSALVFMGNGVQNLNMNGVAGNFDGDIHLAKPTADYIYLQDDLTLNGSGQDLFFKKGWIVSTEAALLTVGNNRNVYNANDSSFVHGVLAKAGNNAFEFPIGKDSVLAAITIQTPNSGYVYTAEYFNVDPDAAGYPVDQRDVSLNSISRCEYWTMTRTGGSSAEYVGLSWDNPRSCEINSETDLVVTAWDGANWTDLGGTGHSGDSNSGSMLSASQTTDFIAFTIGSTNINNPLPIDLVEFKASPADHHVDLFWTTATETDNSHFSIQRSQDGVDWTLLEEIPGAGTSLISIDYNFRDNDPLAGVSYYRLKQTDHNGDFSFSRVESVLMQSDINISVYPNPASGMTTIAGQDMDLMGIELFNATGQLILVQITRTPNKAIVALNNLPGGVYFLSVAHGDTRTTERLIVK